MPGRYLMHFKVDMMVSTALAVVVIGLAAGVCETMTYRSDTFADMVERSPEDYEQIGRYLVMNSRAFSNDPSDIEAFPETRRSSGRPVSRLTMLYDVVDCTDLTASQIRRLVQYIGCVLFPYLGGVPITQGELLALYHYAVSEDVEIDAARFFLLEGVISDLLDRDVCQA